MSEKTFNLEQISKLMDLSPRRVQELAKEGIIPKAERGKYQPLNCVVAYIRHLRKLSQSGGNLELSQERAKLVVLQQEKHDLELKIKRGDYLPKNEVVNELQQFAVILKNSLIGLSRKVATELSPYVDNVQARKIENLVKDICSDCLEQMSVDGVYEQKKTGKKNK